MNNIQDRIIALAVIGSTLGLGFVLLSGIGDYQLKGDRRAITIDFDRIEMVGYGFQIEMKYTAWKMGFRIGEVPIIFADRTEGTSKMSGGIFGEAFFGVLALPFRTIARKK